MAEENLPTCEVMSSQPPISDTTFSQLSQVPTGGVSSQSPPSSSENTFSQPPPWTNQDTVHADSQTATWPEITNKLISQQVLYVSDTSGHGHTHGNALCAHTKGLKWADILDMIISDHNKVCGHTGVVFSPDTIQVNVVLEVEDVENHEMPTSNWTSALTLDAVEPHDGMQTLAAIAASFEDLKEDMEKSQIDTSNVTPPAQAKESCVKEEENGADTHSDVPGFASTSSEEEDASSDCKTRIVEVKMSEVITQQDHIYNKDCPQGPAEDSRPMVRETTVTTKPLKILPAECPICLARFKSRFALRKHSIVHEKDHNKHPCDHCGKVCKTKYHLKVHVDAVHADDSKEKPQRKRSVRAPKRYRGDDDVKDDEGKAPSGKQNRKECDRAKNVKKIDEEKKQVLSESSEGSIVKLSLDKSPKAKKKKSTLCTICNKSFKFPRNLRKHEKIHLKNREHPCTHCDKVCKSAHYLKLHMLVHAEVKRHKCTDCDASFGVLVQLKQHKAREHANYEKHPCTICGALYTNKYNLEDHMIQHSALQKPELCELCGKTFKTPMALRRHTLYHSTKATPSAHLCDRCPQAFSTKALLNMHVRKHHLKERTHKCGVCDNGFFTKQELLSHERVHIEKKTLNFMCSYCGKHFAHKQSLTAHKRGHTGNRISCQLCPKTYTTKAHLKIHQTNSHSEKSAQDKNARPFLCSICGATFKTTTNYRDHQKRHVGIRDRKCAHCDATFVTSSELLRHVRKHMDGKPWKCRFCNASFVKKRDLTEHEGSHDVTKDSPASLVPDGMVAVDIPVGTFPVTVYQHNPAAN